jgi:hypothetical protein
MSDEIKKPQDTPETTEATETPTEPVTKQDRKEYMAQYYAENKDEIAERRNAARIARQEEVNAAERERYATNPVEREQRLKRVPQLIKPTKKPLNQTPKQKRSTKNGLRNAASGIKNALPQTPNTKNNGRY